MKTTDAIKAINKAYKKLVEITSAADLKREKLTLADYNAARATFNEVSAPGHNTETFIESVALFFNRCGYKVSATGASFIIEI